MPDIRVTINSNAASRVAIQPANEPTSVRAVQSGGGSGGDFDPTPVYAHTNLVFGVTNAAFDKANSANSFALSAFITANTANARGNLAQMASNAAYDFANTINIKVDSAYGAVNSNAAVVQAAFGTANAAFGVANTGNLYANLAFRAVNAAYDFANTINIKVDAAFGVANVANARANLAQMASNAAYDFANNINIKADAAFGVANNANLYANLAFRAANAAYDFANTINIKTDAAFGVANVANVRGNLAQMASNAAYDFANTINIKVDSAYGAVNAAFAVANTANVRGNLAQMASNAAYDFANTINIKVDSAFAVANVANARGNLAQMASNAAFNFANTINIKVDSAFAVANTANARANLAQMASNAAYDFANTINIKVDSAFAVANTANARANLAQMASNAAYDFANSINSIARSAFDQANSSNLIIVGNTMSNGYYATRSTRRRLNFVPESANLRIQIEDDSAGDRINVRIESFGTGGGTGTGANLTAANTLANGYSIVRTPAYANINFIGDTLTDFDVSDDTTHYQINVRARSSTAPFAKANAPVYVSVEPPASPVANSLWWNSENAVMSIYYTDGDGSAWVDVSGGSTGGGGSGLLPVGNTMSNGYFTVRSTRSKINFVPASSNVSILVNDDASGDRVNVVLDVIAGSGAGGTGTGANLTAGNTLANGYYITRTTALANINFVDDALTTWNVDVDSTNYRINVHATASRAPFAQSNIAMLTASTAYDKANAANIIAVAAFGVANVANDRANLAQMASNAAFAVANAAFPNTTATLAGTLTTNGNIVVGAAVGGILTANIANVQYFTDGVNYRAAYNASYVALRFTTADGNPATAITLSAGSIGADSWVLAGLYARVGTAVYLPDSTFDNPWGVRVSNTSIVGWSGTDQAGQTIDAGIRRANSGNLYISDGYSTPNRANLWASNIFASNTVAGIDGRFSHRVVTPILNSESGNIVSTTGHRFNGAVSESTSGLLRVDIGSTADTPRIIFEKPGHQIWQIDVENSSFRYYIPGTEAVAYKQISGIFYMIMGAASGRFGWSASASSPSTGSIDTALARSTAGNVSVIDGNANYANLLASNVTAGNTVTGIEGRFTNRVLAGTLNVEPAIVASFGVANTANARANLAQMASNAAYDFANTINIKVDAAFAVANTANVRGNLAQMASNAAYDFANTINIKTDAAFLQANLSNLMIVGNTMANGYYATRAVRRQLNFVPESSNLRINIVDDAAGDRINVRIETFGGGGGGGITEVVQDTSPQLGGDLDLNSFDITGTGNVELTGLVSVTNNIAIRQARTTVDNVALDITADFANTAQTFVLLRANIANTTNVGGGSAFIDLQANGASKFTVDSNGAIKIWGNSAPNFERLFIGGPTSGPGDFGIFTQIGSGGTHRNLSIGVSNDGGAYMQFSPFAAITFGGYNSQPWWGINNGRLEPANGDAIRDIGLITARVNSFYVNNVSLRSVRTVSDNVSLDMTADWANTAQTFTLIRANVANTTNAGSNSAFLDFQANGTSQLRVLANGRITFPTAAIFNESSGIFNLDAGKVLTGPSGFRFFVFENATAPNFMMRAGGTILWADNLDADGNKDLGISRHSAGNLRIGATNLQNVIASNITAGNTVSGIEGNFSNKVLAGTMNVQPAVQAAFAKANAPVHVSDAAPTSPAANSLWWQSNTGGLYIYYSDGDSSQWVETGALGDGPAPSQEVLGFAVSDESTAITTGTNKLTNWFAKKFIVQSVYAALSANASSGNTHVQINKNGTAILSTNITILAANAHSRVGGSPPVLTSSTITFEADDKMNVDIQAAGTGAAGLKVYLIGYYG